MDVVPELKRCTKCGEEKPIDEFSVSKRGGVLSQCKACKRQYNKEWFERPDVKARRIEYYKRPEVKSRMSEYYKRPEVKERYKAHYHQPEVKERLQVRMREYNRRPEVKAYRKERDQQPDVKEQRRIRMKEYRNRPEVKERTLNYRQRSDVKEKDRLYSQEYRQSVKGKEVLVEYYQTPAAKFLKRNREHRRRSRKIHAIATTDEPITQTQWEEIIKNQKNKCLDCGKRFTKKNPPTMDHIVPLSVVPLHSSDNIRAVCARCNARKRDRLVQNYIQTWLYTKKESPLQKL